MEQQNKISFAKIMSETLLDDLQKLRGKLKKSYKKRNPNED